MFNLAVPWWELVLRSVVVFAALLVAVAPDRQTPGRPISADLVLLLILSNAVQNSMNAGDNSLIGGLVSAVTLVLVNYFVNLLVRKYRKVERIVDGRPQILVRGGTLFEDVLADAGITHAELNGALRARTDMPTSETFTWRSWKPNGSISVRRRSETAP